MACILYGNENRARSGIAFWISCLHKDIVAHRQIFQPYRGIFRIVPTALAGVGDGLEIIVIFYDRVIPGGICHNAARCRNLLSILVGGGTEGKYPFRFLIGRHSVCKLRLSFPVKLCMV